jgi:TRAP-type C4-dicarboxylate transport system permease small subunit
MIDKWLTMIVWVLCGIMIVSATIFTFIITFTRYFMGFSWIWAEEVVKYLIIFSALLGSGPMIFQESHICMSLIPDMISSKLIKQVYKIVSAVSILIFALPMLQWGRILVIKTGKMLSYSLIFPMALIYTILPIGIGVIAVYSVLKILYSIYEIWEIKNQKGGAAV